MQAGPSWVQKCKGQKTHVKYSEFACMHAELCGPPPYLHVLYCMAVAVHVLVLRSGQHMPARSRTKSLTRKQASVGAPEFPVSLGRRGTEGHQRNISRLSMFTLLLHLAAVLRLYSRDRPGGFPRLLDYTSSTW